MIKLSAFKWVPPVAQGLVRDLRVRWALEEAGLPYEEHLIGREEQSSASYRELQPFGQVPAIEDDGLVMFESGAIVLHLAERSAALMPADAKARARTMTWCFASLNTIEPPIMFLNQIDAKDEGTKKLRQDVIAAVKKRLGELATALDGRDYLVERFTAADLLMATVLQILRNTGLVAEVPALDAYAKRCTARPAYQKALADQMAPFAKHAPPRTA